MKPTRPFHQTPVITIDGPTASGKGTVATLVAAQLGFHLLDSPVSGGPAGAASGKMALWISGDEASYNKYRPVIDAMGDQIFYMGDVGAA